MNSRLREQLDDERLGIDEERHNVREAEARIAAERSQWETDRQHWHDTLQKRVVELEQDRITLASELEAERRRTSEMAQAATDQHRHFVAERTEFAAEIRELRQRLATPSTKRDGDAIPPPNSAGGDGASDEIESSERLRHEAPIDIVHAEELILKSAAGGPRFRHRFPASPTPLCRRRGRPRPERLLCTRTPSWVRFSRNSNNFKGTSLGGAKRRNSTIAAADDDPPTGK